MKILWAITGAGHLLKESIDVLEKLSDKHEITVILSNAGSEVLKLYGYDKNVDEIIRRNDGIIITEEEEKYSYPFSGKLTHDKYDLVVVSPATANTVAKTAHGIADSLVTNVVAQSGKGRIKCIVVPVDYEEGAVTTVIPPYIDKKLCIECDECVESCAFNALNPPVLNTKRCTCCGKCVDSCLQDAIIIGRKIELYIRKVDADNAGKLEEIENIKTCRHPYDVLPYIIRMEKSLK
ncbi:MAG: hypothetical protein BZ137_06685 [Methanosphaera sp. rholeuAM130]|nr:MAG: hypothetical protein BZ137_06685 [Methanosphaera sp. rholeuAM130]